MMAVENHRKHLEALEQLRTLAKELLKGDAGASHPFVSDRLDAELEQARRHFSSARLRYRDRLDALKVELGLSLHAAVIADAERLAPFRMVVAEIEEWQRDPRRHQDEVSRIINRLAPLESGVLDFVAGRPGLADLAADPARLHPVLLAAESLAIKNRGGDVPDAGIGLQVRRRIRHLIETHTAYETAKRELVSLIRWKDDEFERLIAPPAGEPKPIRFDIPIRNAPGIASPFYDALGIAR